LLKSAKTVKRLEENTAPVFRTYRSFTTTPTRYQEVRIFTRQGRFPCRLDEGTLGTLLTHRLYQDRERAHWGTGYLDHGLVFAREDGVPIAPDHLTKRFGQLAKATGMRAIRLHDLRHGQASMMLAANVHLAVVSKRLGHSTSP
jgi:integrase